MYYSNLFKSEDVCKLIRKSTIQLTEETRIWTKIIYEL